MPTRSRPFDSAAPPARPRPADARARRAARSIRLRRGFVALLGILGATLGFFGRVLLRFDLSLLLLALLVGGLSLWADRRAGPPGPGGRPRTGRAALLAFAGGFGLATLLLALAVGAGLAGRP